METLHQRPDLRVEGYHTARLDLTSPACSQTLSEILDPDTVLIAAARSRRTENPVQSFLADIILTTYVAQGLARQRIKKCVYLSSLSVYSCAAPHLSITEETAIAPTSWYGISQFAGESAVRQATQRAGSPLVVLRPCKIYGPGDDPHAYGPTGFIASIVQGRPIRLFGDGAELRDHLFIRDLVQIILHFAFGDRCGTYNLGTGSSHSYQEIVAALRKVARRELAVTHVEREGPKVDQRIHLEKLLSAMPGVRFTTLEEGLRQTVESMER